MKHAIAILEAQMETLLNNMFISIDECNFDQVNLESDSVIDIQKALKYLNELTPTRDVQEPKEGWQIITEEQRARMLRNMDYCPDVAYYLPSNQWDYTGWRGDVKNKTYAVRLGSEFQKKHFPELTPTINDLVDLCHARSKNAGWWDENPNYAEKICLIHSELSEAMEGLRKDLMDDKLPHRKMEEVEMADAVIRILDYCGQRGFDLEGAIIEKLEFNLNRPDHKIENRAKEGGKKF